MHDLSLTEWTGSVGCKNHIGVKLGQFGDVHATAGAAIDPLAARFTFIVAMVANRATWYFGAPASFLFGRFEHVLTKTRFDGHGTFRDSSLV